MRGQTPHFLTLLKPFPLPRTPNLTRKLLQALTIDGTTVLSNQLKKGVTVSMADAGTTKLSVSIGRQVRSSQSTDGFSTGDYVRVKEYWRSPLAGQYGRIAEIPPGDPCGPYLVRFGNGLQFRYRGDELVALTST